MIPADTVRSLMETYEVPGVAVGVLHGDEEEAAGFGITSAEHPLEVDGDTLFQIGSITKTFTATAAMRLVEQDRLDLDEPIRTYLPDLRLFDEATASAVAMRHLLSHTGGWVGDYFDPITPGDDALALMVARLDHLEQLTPLGETWSYNNAGFYIAGRVIEVVTGKTFEAALQELVLDPFGLERSFFFAEDVMTHRFAVGHHRDGTVARPWPIGRPSAAVGGVISSVRDLLRYASLQLGESELLSAESVAEMRRPHADVVGLLGAEQVGLGWYLAARDGRTFLSHGGATNGQQARLVVVPEERFAFAALTNHDDGGALGGELLASVLEGVLGIEPAATPEHLERAPAELAGYAGTYEAPLTRLEVDREGRRTCARRDPARRLPEAGLSAEPGPAADAPRVREARLRGGSRSPDARHARRLPARPRRRDRVVPRRRPTASASVTIPSYDGKVSAAEWLDSLSPWPREFGLEGMRALLAELGDPQEAYPAIHVVGTNGKSTATVTIEQLLLSEGLAVGSTISPHVASWSERIRLNGEEMDFEDAVGRVREAAERLDSTQFEIVTAAALAAFAEAGVDVAVVEAGLGGRLDATNVLRTRVVLLTNVGLEHMDVLGETREAIAREKLAVAPRDAVVVLADDRYASLVPGREIVIGGAHDAAEAFVGHAIAADPEVVLPGRLERREGEIRDGAHNPDGVEYLVDRIPGGDYTVVVSILADKDADAMLRGLAGIGSRLVATRSSSERALPAEDVARLARRHFAHVEALEDPVRAVWPARTSSGSRCW